jgi:hypothetical protein
MPEFDFETILLGVIGLMGFLWYRDKQTTNIDDERATAIDAYKKSGTDIFLSSVAKAAAMGNKKGLDKVIKEELRKKS